MARVLAMDWTRPASFLGDPRWILVQYYRDWMIDQQFWPVYYGNGSDRLRLRQLPMFGLFRRLCRRYEIYYHN